ncbi:MAG: type II toxin-antitoxin system PemK/MazF family toxin [Verrucomicrobia bacterium]|nr:type II toxin-antitoxin system PemK/MazF family toxin [Verrucomicrobiota bacterium]
MREGAIVLLPLAQANGTVKPRPAVALRQLPGFGDWLVCGVSTQLHQAVAGFDETITRGDADFANSGLVRPSLVRLGFLQAVPFRKIVGRIGSISAERHGRLLANLSRYLMP